MKSTVIQIKNGSRYLKKRVDELEQYGRKVMLVRHSIPYEKEENMREKFSEISKMKSVLLSTITTFINCVYK